MLIANDCKSRGKCQEQAVTITDKADLYGTRKTQADRKRPEYSFILSLVCLALALTVLSLKLTPVAIGSGLNNNDTLVVGP
jgi:hypothetical protein